MNRAVMLGVLLGCSDPVGDDAIEITGYLDASRVSFTRVEDDIAAVGREAAASPLSTVRLENETSGELREGLATEAGTFFVSVPAVDTDRLVLAVDGAGPDDQVAYDVAPHGAFPPHTHIVAHVDPHDLHVAVVEVTFESVRDDGRVWVTNPGAEGTVVLLDPSEGGLVHGGRLEGVEGDLLRAHWVPEIGGSSLAIEIPVGAPAR